MQNIGMETNQIRSLGTETWHATWVGNLGVTSVGNLGVAEAVNGTGYRTWMQNLTLNAEASEHTWTRNLSAQPWQENWMVNLGTEAWVRNLGNVTDPRCGIWVGYRHLGS